MTSPPLHSARRILAAEIGEMSAPGEVAAGAARACEKVSRRFAPLIGDAGVHALFARSLTLTGAEFPWLAAVPLTSPNASWAQLRACLALQPAETAREASASLLAALLGLLEKFIGHGLTARLLHDVWPEVYQASTEEPT